MTAHVTISDVSKRYGEHQVQALQDVSLEIERGSFVAVMGASGCGKSTLLNLIAGIDSADTGSISLSGTNLTALDDGQMTKLRRERIGFVFQFFNLLSTLKVDENVALPLQLSGQFTAREIETRTEQLLAELQIENRRKFYPAQLSGGEMQRVAIARAVIHKPEIVLADEPTGNLDSDNGTRVLQLLKSLNTSTGMSLIMATHSEEAAAFADRVIRMKDGRLIGSKQR